MLAERAQRQLAPPAMRIALMLVAGLLASTGYARPERSQAARAEFVRSHPCPANGHTRGACPGWQVDHVTPLKCGGPDTVANMQWLTVEAHKAKTKAEAKSCRKH